MGYDYPDYRRGTLDKGFVLLSIEEINLTAVIPAGGAVGVDLSTPPLGRFDEVLSLGVLLNNVPAVAPEVRINYYANAGWREGISRALALGNTLNFYELDLSDERLYAYHTTNILQYIQAYITANAAAPTTFWAVGLIARYTFAT